MRAVIQRVTSASVTVGTEVVGKIAKGLCVLVGITNDDDEKDVDWMVKKITTLRLFDDEAGKSWAKSVKDLDLEVLSVSQFTLYALANKGSKPDFHLAAKADISKDMYHGFLEKLGKAHKPDKIQDGRFGAMMDVHINNDGPVTIILDSKQKQ
ncbi:CRE-PQN-68 protein [Fimicolochytrium jonesii]|uniref:CRE-PQN-68 protein n=1 Tax=Fimicolochytrium jonesii TaxID=1396493 RepID=UPI0022FE72E9|nr:CRE-PQN-68 protein [Fimicolochytrium jonesii]KAI8823036.1 CRE-PQN-68 protein [Fimicolochytrium jonesii]